MSEGENTSMAEYPDNLPVCWWTPTGYMPGALPPPFVHACRVDEASSWRQNLEAQGYEHWIVTDDADTSNYGVTAWRYTGRSETAPHVVCELWNIDEQAAFMCIDWLHVAPFLFDKWPDLVRSQRLIDEVSLNKAIIAFIRHGHDTTTISSDGTENFEERSRRLARMAEHRAEREKARRTAATSPTT